MNKEEAKKYALDTYYELLYHYDWNNFILDDLYDDIDKLDQEDFTAPEVFKLYLNKIIDTLTKDLIKLLALKEAIKNTY